MENDHDLIIKHENQINGSDGLMGRMNDIEVWKNRYLLSERAETCFGCEELKTHIDLSKKEKEDNLEMTKTKINTGTLILISLISSVVGPGLMFMLTMMLKK
jgi:hypothetical protein